MPTKRRYSRPALLRGEALPAITADTVPVNLVVVGVE
jgi:hypothetical protein